MTASDILSIATTVGVVQLACSVLANRVYFSKDEYIRASDALGRATWSLNREEQEASNHAHHAAATSFTKQSVTDMHTKRVARAKEALFQAQAKLAGFHVFPNVATSVVFLILTRILGADLGGRVVAILPFSPFSLLYRLTGRGLQFVEDASVDSLESPLITDLRQAAGYMCIYVLCSMSIKTYVGKLVGTEPPAGAEGAHFEQVRRQYDPDYNKKLE